jgi:iron complex transport system permease protein
MAYKKKYFFKITILLIATALVCFISLAAGSRSIDPAAAFKSFISGKPSTDSVILFDIRLPRVIMGFAVGGALSLCGAILQGVFRNPIVEPYTLGISGGATLGVCLNIVTGLSRFGIFTTPVFGFAGAFIVMIVLYSVSIRKGILRMNGLLITGVMISYVSSSILMLVMSISSTEQLHSIIFWIMGSLEEGSSRLIYIMLTASVTGLVISSLFSLRLNAMALGEEEAAHLGINIEMTKRVFFMIAAMLTGLAVSVSGSIAFVGLMVPHFMRIFFGSDNRIVIVTSYFAGAGFLILCDTIARSAFAPTEIPVGVITGLLGGCFFLYAVIGRRRLWER